METINHARLQVRIQSCQWFPTRPSCNTAFAYDRCTALRQTARSQLKALYNLPVSRDLVSVRWPYLKISGHSFYLEIGLATGYSKGFSPTTKTAVNNPDSIEKRLLLITGLPYTVSCKPALQMKHRQRRLFLPLTGQEHLPPSRHSLVNECRAYCYRSG